MNNSVMKVSVDQEQKALVAVETLDLYKQAKAWPYCTGEVFIQPKEFVQKALIPDENKRQIAEALAFVDTVLMVAFWTSTQKPIPLSGSGKMYTFLVHPESFAVIYSGIGTWRS